MEPVRAGDRAGLARPAIYNPKSLSTSFQTVSVRKRTALVSRHEHEPEPQAREPPFLVAPLARVALRTLEAVGARDRRTIDGRSLPLAPAGSAPAGP